MGTDGRLWSTGWVEGKARNTRKRESREETERESFSSIKTWAITPFCTYLMVKSFCGFNCV